MNVTVDNTYTLSAEQVYAIEKFISVYATYPDKTTAYELYSYHKAVVYKGLKLISERIFDKNYVSMSREIIQNFKVLVPANIIRKICEEGNR